MARYYININPQHNYCKDHEVHIDSCSWLQKIQDHEYLGDFPGCNSAVAQARIKYPKADGCAFCSPACNHG